ncbi:MAG: helicase-related protein [Sandaracinaceae bacterium]|nr:helicase-related protein [Sandaracinaceae bacterium]
MVPVTLKNQWNNALRGTQGARQIDGDRLVLEPHAASTGAARAVGCSFARARTRPASSGAGEGEVRFVKEDPDDYDLKVLDEQFALVRAREHSAQVPNEERELLERAFKGTSELVNTLVATPTLELGVDIGALDAVLMRNVPPLAANYWQRAGARGVATAWP